MENIISIKSLCREARDYCFEQGQCSDCGYKGIFDHCLVSDVYAIQRFLHQKSDKEEDDDEENS
ncbi:hypothetical protein [Ileibacterium valens]|uniref:hypothetical protein n=1 Tax=Ileibacterium valens TaxID=1862668 RepID=UPI002731FC0D|nr:hypothetical protein [Ileibacterium valens]